MRESAPLDPVPPRKRTIAISRVANLILMRETADAPSDDEWNGFLAVLSGAGEDLPRYRLLVITDGGGPTPAQRRRLAQVLARRPVKVAVLSDDLRVRFMAATVSLFHPQHKFFGLKSMKDAYAHLGLTVHEQRIAEQAFRDLERVLYEDREDR